MPNEKESAWWRSSARMHARGSSIIVPTRYGRSHRFLDRNADCELAETVELLGEGHERVHDLDVRRLAGARADGQGGAHDYADLHPRRSRALQAEAAAARPQHRVRLVQRENPVPQPLVACLLERGEELVQRRVEQPDCDRQPRHRLEDPLEVGLLEWQEPVERGPPRRLVVREDHLLDPGQALLAEEHVLGAAEPDPLGAQLTRFRRVGRRVGVRVHFEVPDVVRPAEPSRDPRSACRNELDRAESLPVPPSTVITSPSATRRPTIEATLRSRSIVGSEHPATQGFPIRARRAQRGRRCRRVR